MPLNKETETKTYFSDQINTIAGITTVKTFLL